MVTFLITTALVLGLFAIAIYFWQKPANSSQTIELPPEPPRVLFSESHQAAELNNAETTIATNNGHAPLFSRAAQGDLNVLVEAKHLEVYPELLNVFVSTASSKANLLSLVSHVIQHDLPINRQLAEAMVDHWRSSPDRQTTMQMLHSAALSNDGELYNNAVEMALGFWRDGKLSGLSGTELQALIASEFWLLSTEVRNSGIGFVLKRTLSSARSELEGTTNN